MQHITWTCEKIGYPKNPLIDPFSAPTVWRPVLLGSQSPGHAASSSAFSLRWNLCRFSIHPREHRGYGRQQFKHIFNHSNIYILIIYWNYQRDIEIIFQENFFITMETVKFFCVASPQSIPGITGSSSEHHSCLVQNQWSQNCKYINKYPSIYLSIYQSIYLYLYIIVHLTIH